ncbi:DsbA family protein [Fulvimarina endophytica]|uniref:DsbA family protein n=1 Tax=Fulvimarina endophytica TaxID=2293836 RepID=A0A371X2U8_9HYPH|nr:DsbA family protein [Fulvimarina endophytica]RFC63539.1 DsbA family protein [Fulvimarina endophytica]
MPANLTIHLDYFFDPLCGWCYASAPALSGLAKAYPDALAMRPSGLFSNGGTQPMSTMADHAWRNDTRIAELTGQRFTEDYRDHVLRDPEALFDSTHATRAIVALGAIDTRLEPVLLHALQTARYVEARDTAKPDIVAAVAAQVARSHGHGLDEASLADRLVRDGELAKRTDGRVRETLMHMRALSCSGVPQLLVSVGDHREMVQGADLYGGADAATKAVERIAARAKARSN